MEPPKTASSDQIKADYERAGFRVKKSFFSGAVAVTGTHGGVSFTCETTKSKSRTGVSHFQSVVSINGGLSGDFVINREKDADRFFKRIGFSTEVQTGDAEFDSEFYLIGTSSEYVKALFASAKNREVPRKLFGLGFDSVQLHGSKFSATKRNASLLLDLPSLKETVEQMESLRAPSSGAAMEMPKTRITMSHIRAVCSGMAFIAVVLFFTASYVTEPIVNGWWYAAQSILPKAVSAIAVLFIIAVIALRGRASAHYELFFIVAMGMPSILFGGWGAIILANQFLDKSELQAHKTVLVDYYKEKSKRSAKYYLVFKSWHPGGGTLVIEAPPERYSMASRHKHWIIRTHQGYLGFEWVR